jgi:hypothetical protein
MDVARVHTAAGRMKSTEAALVPVIDLWAIGFSTPSRRIAVTNALPPSVSLRR